MSTKMLTPEDWAERYGLNIQTVWKKIRQGNIRAINIGGGRRRVYRIPASETDRYDRENSAA